MSGFGVQAEQLRDHATAVQQIADGVTQAAQAAEEVGVGGEIYGVLSVIVVPVLSGLFGDTRDLVAKAGTLGDAYADGLQTSTDLYEDADTQAKSLLHDVLDDLIS